MAVVAAQISVGRFPLPGGARTYLQAGTAINPASSGVPFSFSRQAVAGAPQYVSQRAAKVGFNNWADLRRHRFDY
jgi:hypothetical protein